MGRGLPGLCPSPRGERYKMIKNKGKMEEPRPKSGPKPFFRGGPWARRVGPSSLGEILAASLVQIDHWLSVPDAKHCLNTCVFV